MIGWHKEYGVAVAAACAALVLGSCGQSSAPAVLPAPTGGGFTATSSSAVAAIDGIVAAILSDVDADERAVMQEEADAARAGDVQVD